MKIWNYTREPLDDKRYQARIEDRKSVFIKFDGKWEFYITKRNGIEEFQGYVEGKRNIDLLDQALRYRSERERHAPYRVLPFDTELGFVVPAGHGATGLTARSERHRETEREKALRKDESDLQKTRKVIKELRAGKRVPNWTLEGALATERGLVAAIRNKKKLG